MDLKKLYSLRRDFTIIGLTGRTGSGCSRIAELLSEPFETLKAKGLRPVEDFTDEIFKRKYSICKKFLEHGDNWVPFEIIRYVDVLLFYILHKHGGNKMDWKKLVWKYYKETLSENNSHIVPKIFEEVIKIDAKYKDLIRDIKSLKDFNTIKTEEDLSILGNLFLMKSS